MPSGTTKNSPTNNFPNPLSKLEIEKFDRIFPEKMAKILIDRNYREKKYLRVEILTIARKCTRENMTWTDGKIPIHPRRFYAKLETDGRNGARATESFRWKFSEKSDRFDCTSTKRRLWQLHRKRPPSKSDVENIERGGEVE